MLIARGSLRSKRFQSSYCAKVRAEAKKKVPSFPSPSPVVHFFCSSPSFLDEPRKETLATQATLAEIKTDRFKNVYVNRFIFRYNL